MRILVTGANGYLGQRIVKNILDNGNEVIAAGFKFNNIDNRVKKVKCNLFDVRNSYDYFKRSDVLLHLARRDGFIHYSDSHINDLPKHYSFINDMVDAGIKHIAVLES